MLVWACIAPHGGELIPELAQGNLDRMAVTRDAMAALGSRCRASRPDTIVVLTPHGIQAPDYLTVSACETAEGALQSDCGASVTADFVVNVELAESISERGAAAGHPVLPIGFADADHNLLPFQLDWGSLVPLWFMGAGWDPRPRIVVLCPSRSLPRQTLLDFGRKLAMACEENDARIALVCSADQGHGHDAAGPYGFAPESAEYDSAYVRAVRGDSLHDLLEWDAEWIDCAMADSYWQTLILHGAILQSPMSPELLSYEAPTYFGMACVAYHRKDAGL